MQSRLTRPIAVFASFVATLACSPLLVIPPDSGASQEGVAVPGPASASEPDIPREAPGADGSLASDLTGQDPRTLESADKAASSGSAAAAREGDEPRPTRDEAPDEIAEIGGILSGDALELSMPTGEAFEQAARLEVAGDAPQYDLPQSYDVRETNPAGVTPPRNQMSWDTCWAFAQATSIEWSIAKNGAVSEPTEISVAHIKQGHGGLVEFYGPRLESDFPYVPHMPPLTTEPEDKEWQISDADLHTSDFHYRNSYYTAGAWKNREFSLERLAEVKRLIYDHGVVAAGIEVFSPGIV
jgi:hypothetical protein